MKHEPEEIPRDSAALAWARRTGTADEVYLEVHRQVRRRRRRRLAIASASLLIVVLAAIKMRAPRAAPRDFTTIPATATIVLPAKQTLPDGSTVELKDDASINVEFGAALRRVTLASGEAHFQVEKDGARPFVVVASGVAIRAVGTTFSVQLGQQAVEVLVTEGEVEVDQPVSSAARSIAEPVSPPKRLARVPAGNRVSLNVEARTTVPAPEVVAITKDEMAQRLSWRVPRLRFFGTPLAEAIPLFNRHSRLQLVIGDPEIGKLNLSGILRADNTDSLVQLLQVEFAVRAEPRGELEIVLRR